MSSALNLLIRHTPEAGPVGWDEVITGDDLGLLAPGDVLTWLRLQAGPGEVLARPDAPGSDAATRLERIHWAACAAATGSVPRPGHLRWHRAQDRWRVALLRDALAAAPSPEALALEVEAIYDQVGCPEDMVGLWSRARGSSHPPTVHLEALQAFLQRLAPSLLPQAG